MIKFRKIHAIFRQRCIRFLAIMLFLAFITGSSPILVFGDEYTASGHRVGSIPEKPAGGEEGSTSILADNMIVGNVIGIEATFGIARIQEYNPVTHTKVSEFSVPCPSGSCNGRGLAFDGVNFWYSILTGGLSFTGDGLIHKIGMSGGADILTISDGYGAGGRGIGAIDFIPGSTDMLVISYLPDNDTNGTPNLAGCIADDTNCLEEVRRLDTSGTTLGRCDIPFNNSGGTGVGTETLVVTASGTTFYADGGEADLMFIDEYKVPTSITAAGTLCDFVQNFSSTPVGIGGLDFDLAGQLVVSSTFATGIGNLDGSPYSSLVGGTFTTDTNIEDITIKKPSLGKIIIIKNVVPDGPQDFRFTHNIPSNPTIASPFFLDDDFSPPLSNMQTFLQVPAGSYTVTEMTVPGIPLRSIRCISTDPADSSGRVGNSAIIDLNSGETVTCTFVNGIAEAPCEDGMVSVPQAEDPMSMTTIRNKNIVKTMHIEKQIFDCELPQGDIPVIADVTIIAEIYEDLNTKSVISKQVEVVTCIKDPVAMRVMECALSIPTTDRIPVTNCQELTVNEEISITHPQEMNTIRKGSIAKTVEAQKEVFTCYFPDGPDQRGSENPNDKKVDLVIFTEIYQNLDTQTPADLQILSMKCVIKIDTVTVESCHFRTVL